MYQLNQSKNAVIAHFSKKIETDFPKEVKSISPDASMNTTDIPINNSHKIDSKYKEEVKSIYPVASMNTQTETIKVKTTTNKPEKKYIYMCSWFETKRHRISHTNMFFEKAEDTNWIFDTPDWFHELVRIEYICVMSNTKEYSMVKRIGG